ncbi:MAG: alpha/beta hydrolase [Bacteroidota bacterium]
MPQAFQHRTKAGNSLQIDLYGADSLDKQACIVYVHGFKGFKDWGFVPFVAQQFVEAGFSFLTFNFSHNGIGSQPETFTELDKFAQNTFSLEVAETLEIIQLLTHTDFFGRDLHHGLGLLGHSRGGGIAILAGQRAAGVKAVGTWASVSTFDRYSKEDKAAWRKDGFKTVLNSRTKQEFQLGVELLEDVEKNAKTSLNIQAAAGNLGKPLLLVHGQNDETVPYFEAEHLNIYADPGMTRMRLIPQTGHTLGAAHPFTGSNPSLDLAITTSLEFFQQSL